MAKISYKDGETSSLWQSVVKGEEHERVALVMHMNMCVYYDLLLLGASGLY